ncbi:AfsR/SARP family transcriptional regulator [Kutzneria chonburiensis]|uniref:BTAD domain-containing putative transcriptional regulator n=1 Tax=Kutzneria chonburiensis TaxID=1483604 RepID=A0ABV6MJE6_9PSEU|nr:BTAD domain-containing putative transcriptional regulator [Kutzneria chonburiensis]
MELLLLGPVRARVGDTVVNLGPRQQRLVLAVLAWDVNRVVPLQRLVEWLWPADPPRRATHAVHVLVSNLRSILAGDPDMTISTDGVGYALRADPRQIDVHRFVDGVAKARAATDDQTRVTRLDQALLLWTGPALADTASSEVRERLCGGLEQTRLTAMEDRFDGILRLGGHQQVLGELTSVADAHPTRERLIGQLMLALHRSGQTSRALDAAQRTRALLAEELGIDPGAELRRLELAILRDDRALDPVAPRRADPGTPVPAQRTRLVGRDHDVAEIVDRLTTGDARLLTLTGPGGVGKTRLATEAARQCAQHVADGVVVVSLAPVDDPNLVLPTIASSLAIRETDGAQLRTALRARLRDRKLLLLLIDNVEHLVDAGPDIAWLLDVAPGLTVLATSRAPLRLTGEHVWSVTPLDSRSAAELFDERARQAGSARVGHDPAVVDAICRCVDRLPLGIELAAARTRLLPPAALLHQLERSHDLLGGGGPRRTGPTPVAAGGDRLELRPTDCRRAVDAVCRIGVRRRLDRAGGGRRRPPRPDDRVAAARRAAGCQHDRPHHGHPFRPAGNGPGLRRRPSGGVRRPDRGQGAARGPHRVLRRGSPPGRRRSGPR